MISDGSANRLGVFVVSGSDDCGKLAMATYQADLAERHDDEDLVDVGDMDSAARKSDGRL